MLDDPAALARALRLWEQRRDRECLPSYHFANIETRVESASPALVEIIRRHPVHPAPDLGDLGGRARSMPQILTLPRITSALVIAMARPRHERPEGLTLAHTLRDLRIQLEVRRELLTRPFRSHVRVEGSEHPHAEPPAYRPAAHTPARHALPSTAEGSRNGAAGGAPKVIAGTAESPPLVSEPAAALKPDAALEEVSS